MDEIYGTCRCGHAVEAHQVSLDGHYIPGMRWPYDQLGCQMPDCECVRFEYDPTEPCGIRKVSATDPIDGFRLKD